MNPEKLSIQATVSASPEKTWELYNDPKHIVNWNFAADDWHCPWAINDLRPGGSLKARMEARDGSMGFEYEGFYEEIRPSERLRYALGDGRIVEAIFQPIGDSTLVTVTFDPEDTHSLEMQREGWQSILDNFKKYVNAN